MAGTEYVIRGLGYFRSIEDIELVTVGTDGRGTPILVRDIARVQLGPEQRRGVAELDGKGQAVGGMVIMRAGENALGVIERVKARLEEITPSLPKGVRIVPTYDRSDLILRAIAVLREKLVEESIIVSLIATLFLFHFRSALVVILILPVAVPLSFTKTFAMLFATALSVTLAPVLMVALIRGRIRAETRNPLNWLLITLYRPLLSAVLRVRWLVLALAIAAMGLTIPVFGRLGAEFMQIGRAHV